MGQSSNDAIPTAIHVAASLAVHEQLLPALAHLATTIERKGKSLKRITKTGRTHLMDAMPLRFDQELVRLGAAAAQRHRARRVLAAALAGAGAGRHCGRHRHQCRRALRRALRQGAGQAHACRVHHVAELFREPVEPGRRGGNERPAEDRRGVADQDRQRSALDEFRPARWSGRDRTAGAAAGLVDHAGQSQPGDRRSHRDGLRQSHWQRRDDHDRRPERQFSAQRACCR
jgi:hypothetical protein